MKINTVHRLYNAVFREEIGLEVLDFQQGLVAVIVFHGLPLSSRMRISRCPVRPHHKK
jgi:hypothetical protein